MFAIRDTASRSYKFRSKAELRRAERVQTLWPIILQNFQEQLSCSHAAEGVPPLLVTSSLDTLGLMRPRACAADRRLVLCSAILAATEP